MIIIAEVIKENSDEFEISVVEVDAPFVITKVKDKLYIYKGGNCILTKALSLEIFVIKSAQRLLQPPQPLQLQSTIRDLVFLLHAPQI